MDEFKTKLEALMREYNVSIGFNVGDSSDTHGLYDEHMYIDNGKNRIQIWGYSFIATDIKDAKIEKTA